MMSQASSLGGQTLVSLNEVKQGPEDYEDHLLVQSSEEVIESDVTLSQQVDPEDMTVPLPENNVLDDVNVTSSKKRKIGKNNKKIALKSSKAAKKWEHKSVKIKTLEGEFSASMWASGMIQCFIVKVRKTFNVFIKDYYYCSGLTT